MQPADYRPISITPVLSRTLERFVVHQYIYPVLPSSTTLSFSNQYAFRPTGSTCAALIAILQTLTKMLANNPYVLLYALDFSKAFDSVRHRTLMEKLAQLALPDHIFNWIAEFFQDHAHCTKHKEVVSATVKINASVIQGSAIGPATFIVNAADMKTLSDKNALFKYADDTYLIVPADNVTTVNDELANIETWAAENNLRLNQAKSVEVVFRDPARKKQQVLLVPHASIPRTETIKILGVTLTSHFSMRPHIDLTLTACSQTLFALKTLRAHGMQTKSLRTVFKSVALSKLQYSSQAWRGFTTCQDRERLEGFMRKSKR